MIRNVQGEVREKHTRVRTECPVAQDCSAAEARKDRWSASIDELADRVGIEGVAGQLLWKRESECAFLLRDRGTRDIRRGGGSGRGSVSTEGAADA